MKHFDSDYMEGCHPQVMQRLIETNLEQTPGYGSDSYCAEAKRLIAKALGKREQSDACIDYAEQEEARPRVKALGTDDVDIHFLIGGTQTNSTVIDALLMRHEGVLAAETAHINVHESGAIEACGHKVLTLPSHDGKVCAKELKAYIDNFYADETYEHMVAPGMVYISYPTEYGTLYSKEELTDLHDICMKADIPLYIDGARLGYGLASDKCDITLSDLPDLCDIFYIGGTKVGALFGECVVAKKGLLKHFFPLIKQHGALLAKGRLLGVQFSTLFTDDLYLKISRHAIELAMMLKKGFVDKGYMLFLDSPTNQQFFVLPNDVMDRLSRTSSFEVWGTRGEHETTVRFVTSWATKKSDVEELISEL